MASAEQNQDAQPKLGLWDAVSIILGIIIGAGIYETPPGIFAIMGDAWLTLGLWAVCGLLALVGAFCYAELATAYPRSGGDYVYITRAYGPLPGYLFGWSQLAVIQTGSIGLMAYIFAGYANRLNSVAHLHADLGKYTLAIYAAAAIVAVTLLNIIGVVLGKIAQNILTFAKIVGLGAIIYAGFSHPDHDFAVHAGTIKEIKTNSQQIVVDVDSNLKTFAYTDSTKFFVKGFPGYTQGKLEAFTKTTKDAEGKEVYGPVKILTRPVKPEEAFQVMVPSFTEGVPVGPLTLPPWGMLSLALVFVFLTYGGWNDAAFVAAEVRDEGRNIPRALIIGTVGVTFIYLAVNYAYLNALGFERAQVSTQVAADVLSLLPGEFGQHGEMAMCILVMVSALGAVNGLVYTSSRIYSTLGKDYSLFAPLGAWNKTLGTPVWSLLLQMLIALAMVGGVGTEEGQEYLNQVVEFVLGSPPHGAPRHLNWEGEGGFNSLLRCTAPIFWIFFLMTGLAMFILRLNDPNIARPFHVPFFPVIPVIFCATCAYMIYSGINYAGKFGLVGLVLVALGLPFYVFSRRSAMTDTHGSK
jgi:amino acid transporter